MSCWCVCGGVLLVCVLVCLCCCVCGGVCGGVCGVCGTLKTSVCRIKTPPCVPAKRPCHIRHGRFGGTHGDVLNLYTEAFWIYTRTHTNTHKQPTHRQHTQEFHRRQSNTHAPNYFHESTQTTTMGHASYHIISTPLSSPQTHACRTLNTQHTHHHHHHMTTHST